MKIRAKLVSSIIPIVLTFMITIGVSSFFLASNGINNIARRYLSFKILQLNNYMNDQWKLLEKNNLQKDQNMVKAAKGSFAYYAKKTIESDSEIIFALEKNGDVFFSTNSINLDSSEVAQLFKKSQFNDVPFSTYKFNGIEYVASGFYFLPFDLTVVVANEKTAYYSEIYLMQKRIVILVLFSIIIGTILIVIISNIIVFPLKKVSSTIEYIAKTSDLSKKVDIKYNDEVGHLSQVFNNMGSELDNAYKSIKNYALSAVVAKKNESKIRQIFQKYVPQELINKFFENPEGMLVGDNRKLAILFSDIRSFTSISENMEPDVLVKSLNEYFSSMVDIIVDKKGIVDKYIGDAIMAFWGAPVNHIDTPALSLHAALLMLDKLNEFNAAQVKKGKVEFKIGIGINYGLVTVGNIGTDKKMDYTVIGDAVNLASRLEGLTKEYKQGVIFSEFLQEEIKNLFPCRLLDSVAVKGKSKGVKIYTTKKDITKKEFDAWKLHNNAMSLYYKRDFENALLLFKEVASILENDTPSKIMIERCKEYVNISLPEDWDGVSIKTSK